MRKMVYLDMWLFVRLEAIYRHMPIVNMRKFATAAPNFNLRRPALQSFAGRQGNGEFRALSSPSMANT
jgi:hypothetical protein